MRPSSSASCCSRFASVLRSALPLLLLSLALIGPSLQAQVPGMISYQGRVAVSSAPFSGSGQFKFALVNSSGTSTFWSHDGTSTAGSEPTSAINLTVASGFYSVLLGANMTAVPATVFDNEDVRLRVWFSDGVNGSQLLTPDQRIASVGYAMRAATATSAQTAGSALTVANNAVTADKMVDAAVGTPKLADAAVTQAKLANNSVGSAQIINGGVMAEDVAANAVTSDKIADGAVTTAKIPDGSITQAKLGFAIGGGSGSGVPSGAREYTTAGTHTFTVPAGVTKIMVEVWGAGAGVSYLDGLYGGSGAYSRKTFTVTAASQWTVVVGAGGAVVETGASPHGGNSSFTSLSNSTFTLVSQGGRGQQNTSAAAAPAVPDVGADIARFGSFGRDVIIGSVAPPFVTRTIEGEPGYTYTRQHSEAGGEEFALGLPVAGEVGYVLIQW